MSTWFANARRRLKKENKLYPGDRGGKESDDDDDDDDDDDGSRRQVVDESDGRPSRTGGSQVAYGLLGIRAGRQKVFFF